MSLIVEVFYKSPLNPLRELVIAQRVSELGGRLTYREEPVESDTGPVCLTYEFNGYEQAEEAASQLRIQGEHVEGPMDYGD